MRRGVRGYPPHCHSAMFCHRFDNISARRGAFLLLKWSPSSCPQSCHSSREMSVQLDDEDDLKFSAGASSYKMNEEDQLLPPREMEFREYLCDSKAVDEIVRLLVGLAENPSPPENPVADWRAMYDAERAAFKEKPHLLTGLAGPQMTSSPAPSEDIPALLDENDKLRAREAELSAQLHGVVSQIEARDAEAAAPVLDALLADGGCKSEVVPEALDVAKLYASLSARFPAPAEDAEPPVWAAEGAVAPAGAVTIEGLREWAKATFGYGAPALEGALDLPTFGQCASGAECEVDEAKASGLYAACVKLASHAVEPSAEE